MKRMLIAMAVGFLTPMLPASASFIKNYGTWRSLGGSAKANYAMGAYDATFALIAAGDGYAMADADGVRECSAALKLNSSMLAELIDATYAQDPSKWNYPAAAVLYTSLVKLCKVQINDHRRAKGLDLVK